MKAVDEGNFLCGIFVDLEKTIDTVDHNILLKRLDHCGVRGISNKWFESYLTDRKQFDSIQFINIDLKDLTKWLTVNKIYLNVSKTEMVLFRTKRKSMEFNLKIKLDGKRL